MNEPSTPFDFDAVAANLDEGGRPTEAEHEAVLVVIRRMVHWSILVRHHRIDQIGMRWLVLAHALYPAAFQGAGSLSALARLFGVKPATLRVHRRSLEKAFRFLDTSLAEAQRRRKIAKSQKLRNESKLKALTPSR